jgi:hypothetical protein
MERITQASEGGKEKREKINSKDHTGNQPLHGKLRSDTSHLG